MNVEEAQQLIADIKNNICLTDDPDFLYVKGLKEAVSVVEKIITRFASRPPYTSTWSNGAGTLKLREFVAQHTYIGFSIEFNESTFAVSIDEAKQLRDNINRMLEYLENEIIT